MNNAMKTLAFLALITVSAFAARSFNSASDAAMNCPEVKNYLNQGFTLDSVEANNYYYIMAPTGTFAWGEVVVKLHGKTGGPYSLETTYATVTCYIQGKEQGGNVKYSATGTDVQEITVY